MEHTLALAALIQAMVKELAEHHDAGKGLSDYPYQMLDENKWLAARHGLAASSSTCRRATGWGRRSSRAASCDRLREHAEDLGSAAELAGIEDLLARGNGAARQLVVYEANHDLNEVMAEIVDATDGGCMREPIRDWPPSRTLGGSPMASSGPYTGRLPHLFVVCKKCGSEVSPYITECPYCGTRLRKRAPKIERDGTLSEPRAATRPARKPDAPAPGPDAPGEIPGIRAERCAVPTRPGRSWSCRSSGTCCSRSPAAATSRWPARRRGVVAARDDPVPVRERLVRAGRGHLDRRSSARCSSAVTDRSSSSCCSSSAAPAAPRSRSPSTATRPWPSAATGPRSPLLAAWAVPDLLRRRRGEDVEGDLLGVAVIAVLLLALPAAAAEASVVAGLGGALAGLLVGLLLARVSRA